LADFIDSPPHLKVNFLVSETQGRKTGSNLSQDIPVIPEPETYALMLAGLAAIGFVARRRKTA
jgi:PEP-CTERM motif